MKKKVCIVVSSMMTVKAFLIEHIAALSQKYEVSVVANTKDIEFFSNVGVKAILIPICIERKIDLWSDFKVLFQLFCLFRKARFDVVHSVTPKAGFLAMIAGVLLRVPIRIHIFTGQVWVTSVGPMRWVLKSVDCLLAFLTTDVLVDSFSQQQFLIKENVVNANKTRVLAKGSISGVDIVRFSPNSSIRKKIRRTENLSDLDIAFLYLGRLNKDKGL
ncbi:MAG: glycosyltransferase family 1 protein, partial [Candidatus Heimdallarchaeota archaeon]|nr:glycosyltransferase family 1 protein [Candidatus Heimdallarchaeota archaeon]